ncbi:uncharacterized protein Triagg1_8939 [Trichoderma aggressivum f. europaeum]|uniref:Serine hydrolase domain-containing protein n=1 Tax=Trichoderma aggressivum f. europaeum TaxID=173218 RepID=A0AAE1LVT9_9HYPO|nr:hypothetical protein Triagg1_8939 [Trichoderma aggressivum f. europaeum]
MEDLTLPRILCIHGAGVNAQVFEIQCRAIIGKLRDKFRFVFVDGHMEDEAHPAVVNIFGELAPFKRWLVYKDAHETMDPVVASQKLAKQLQDAIDQDKGTGEWAGLIGFSQGGVISSSLLWAQDHIEDDSKRPLPGITFRFAVVMSAPGPIVHIDRTGTLTKPRHLIHAGERMSYDYDDWPVQGTQDEAHMVLTPTLHIHGLQDPALFNHRKLYEYSKRGTATRFEWDGGHRLPIRREDVERTVNMILQLAERTGMEFYYDDAW